MLLNSFLQCRPIDVVEAVLKVNLDWGRHLCIITIGKGLKMITGKDCGVVGNLYTSWDGTAKLPKLCKQLGKKCFISATGTRPVSFELPSQQLSAEPLGDSVHLSSACHPGEVSHLAR